MKFQAKLRKVGAVHDSYGEKYTDVSLRLYLQPNDKSIVENEQTAAHISMFLAGLLYESQSVIVDILPEDMGVV